MDQPIEHHPTRPWLKRPWRKGEHGGYCGGRPKGARNGSTLEFERLGKRVDKLPLVRAVLDMPDPSDRLEVRRWYRERMKALQSNPATASAATTIASDELVAALIHYSTDWLKGIAIK